MIFNIFSDNIKVVIDFVQQCSERIYANRSDTIEERGATEDL